MLYFTFPGVSVQEQNTRNAIKSFLANSASSSSGSTSDASTDSPLAHVTHSPHARIAIASDPRHGGPQMDVVDSRPRSVSMSMYKSICIKPWEFVFRRHRFLLESKRYK